MLGRLLFSRDDIKKKVKVLSGGEKGRMLFGKLMMQRSNILVMDEPTNHRYGIHRIAEHGAGDVRRHADLRLPRP